ncbi:MAG: hypothetical protein ACRD9Y_10530, partial [Blastocatellia bacterium]
PLPGLGGLLGLSPVVLPPANIRCASGTKTCVETNGGRNQCLKTERAGLSRTTWRVFDFGL